jgi:hypothetical protein
LIVVRKFKKIFLFQKKSLTPAFATMKWRDISGQLPEGDLDLVQACTERLHTRVALGVFREMFAERPLILGLRELRLEPPPATPGAALLDLPDEILARLVRGVRLREWTSLAMTCTALRAATAGTLPGAISTEVAERLNMTISICNAISDSDFSNSLEWIHPKITPMAEQLEMAVSIRDVFFTKCPDLILPPGIELIPPKSFYSCKSLRSIVLQSGVKSIMKHAFFRCESLVSIVLPPGLKCVGKSAFEYCPSLISVKLPISCKEVGKDAFFNCYALRAIIIPGDVKHIEDSTFEWCRSLESIALPGSVESIGMRAFLRCSALRSITIPRGVGRIRYRTFECSGLVAITIPGNVKHIDVYAFHHCISLHSVTLSTGVEGIGLYAFLGCSALRSIAIPASVTTISHSAFIDCACLDRPSRERIRDVCPTSNFGP